MGVPPPPSSDILTSTGVRSVGWVAMYVIIISQKFHSDFDVGFSAVGDVKCLDQTWLFYGQTRTALSPCPNAPAPVMSCPPSIPVLRVLPPSSYPRAMYEVPPYIPTMLNLINSFLHTPGDGFSAKVRIHYTR